jgi:predicted permease
MDWTRRVRAASAASSLAGLGNDVRYALSLLRRQWGHTCVVALTMALGVGASTVLFSVVYGVLLKPLPWPDADRLVRLTETREGSTRPERFLTNATFLAWNQNPATIEGLTAWSTATMTTTGIGESERVRVVEASPALFRLLGGQPAIGRVFDTAADGVVDEAQVVLSHGWWQRQFGGSRDAIGRAVRLDGNEYRVVAVMPPGFAFPDTEVRAWIPFNVKPVIGKDPQSRTLSMFSAIAKLRPGVSAAQAAAEGTARGRHAPDPGFVTMAVFGSRGPVRVSAVPLVTAMTGDVRPALIVFLVAVGLLLATATANVASLQIVRATARRREIAIRTALGAGGVRLTRQLLIENAIVGQFGGLLGLLFAVWTVRILPAVLPADFPRVADVAIDWRIAVFAVGVSLLASLAFGLAPAVQARHVNVTQALAEDGLAPVGGGSRSRTARARLAIMAGQIAVAAVLLVGASLLTRSFIALIHADRGFDASNVLTARLVLPDASFTPQRRAEVLDRILERLKSVPGVNAAAISTRLPLLGSGEALGAFPVPARRGGGTVSAHASVRVVSPGYFAALGLRMVEGRGFTDADTVMSGDVLVVNRAFAQKYLDAPAVGTRLPGSSTEREVVGVIDNIRSGPMTETVQPEIFRSTRQLSSGFEYHEPAIVVRTAGDPTRIVPILRSVVRDQDPAAVLESVMTMEDRVWTSLAKPRLYALLLGGFAAFALAIAGVGLFGVLSYGVSLRSREIGVRTSLGATPWNIAGLVLRQALVVTCGGLVVGLAVAAALARALSQLLYGVATSDTVSFIVVPALLVIVAVCACLLPARRAARLDPMKALR